MNKMRFLKILIIYICLLLFSSIGVQTAKAGDSNDSEEYIIAAEDSVAGYVATIMVLREVFGLNVPSFWEIVASDNPYLGYVPDGRLPDFNDPNLTMEYNDESDPETEEPANTKPAEKPSKPLTPEEVEMRDIWKKAWEETWGESWPVQVDGPQQNTSGGDSTNEGVKNEWEGLEEEFPEGGYIPFKGEGENPDEDEEMKPDEGQGGGILGDIERLRLELKKCKDDNCRKQVQEKINRAMAEAAKALNELSRLWQKDHKVVPPEGEKNEEQTGGVIGEMQKVLESIRKNSNSTMEDEQTIDGNGQTSYSSPVAPLSRGANAAAADDPGSASGSEGSNEFGQGGPDSFTIGGSGGSGKPGDGDSEDSDSDDGGDNGGVIIHADP